MIVRVTMKNIAIVLILLIGFTGLAAAQDISGEIVYLDGGVDVHRDGELLDYYEVDIGLDLERFDLLETDDIGYAEIEVNTPSSRGTTVRVFEDTAFYFDYDDSGGSRQTRFEMLTGSLALKVQKLTGNGDVVIKTESAVMGVRGTEFTVTAAPEGSVLITCEEGEVSCQSGGKELRAVPGRAVEQPRDGGLREIAVEVGDLGNFRTEWFNNKLETFVPSAGIVVKAVGQRYQDFVKRFETSYSELMSYNHIFKKWERGLKEGAGMGTFMKDKITVSPAIVRMRTNLFMFERLFYRIKALEKVYDEYNIPSSRLWSGYSTDNLFRDFSRKQKDLEFKLAQTRYIMKLFSQVSASAMPGSDFGSDFGDMDMDMDSFGDNPMGGGNKPF